MSPDNSNSSRFTMLALAVLAGALYCAVHLLNGLFMKSLEISDHINFLYLPSFLRLINVLVLGLVWGTLGTAFGGILLMYFWVNDSFIMALCNTVVSASGAALAVLAMRILQQRHLSLTKLSDLLQLALLYALLNALLHHLLWTTFDPAQIVSPNQVAYMVIGDLNGAILGALALRWLATRTRLIDLIRHRAHADEP
jgi:integral membrane sensor domain MASE1